MAIQLHFMPLKKVLSERAMRIREGSIRKLLKIAVERKEIISLGPGEPDFKPPKHIITAAKKALSQGYTHYSPVTGRKELKEEIVKKLKRKNKIKLNPENIIVTTGSTEAILLSLMCTVDPGEHVLVPDPGFICYQPMTQMLNGFPETIPLYFEKDFQYDVNEMKKIIDPERARAIIINTPSNPTGAVLKKKCLEEIAQFAVDNDILIISDEAYEDFVYKGKHTSIGSLNGMQDYVLTLHTFSKIYGMAGFRLGYAAGPKKVIDKMSSLHITTTLSAPTVSQIAALSALKGPKSFMKKIIKEYNKRRIFLVKRLKEIGFEPFDPEGAFYVFSKYPSKMNSVKFSNWLLKNAKVAALPGIDFGKMGEGFVRFSFATDFSLIKKAMNRIEKSMKKLKK